MRWCVATPPRELGNHSFTEHTSHYSISQLKLVNKFGNLNSIINNINTS